MVEEDFSVLWLRGKAWELARHVTGEAPLTKEEALDLAMEIAKKLWGSQGPDGRLGD